MEAELEFPQAAYVQVKSALADVVFRDFSAPWDWKNYNKQEQVAVVSMRRRRAMCFAFRALKLGKPATSHISKIMRSYYHSGLERKYLSQSAAKRSNEGHFADDDPAVAEAFGYPIDYSKAPPDGHPARCHGRNPIIGTRCKRWGTETGYCKFCGRNRQNPIFNGKRELNKVKLMGYGYAASLGPALRDKLAQFVSGKTMVEQLALYDEIALARLLVAQQTEVYAALVNAMTSGDKNVTQDHLNQCTAVLNQCMEHVANLCQRMANIEKNIGENVSMASIANLADQITILAGNVIGQDPEGQRKAKALGDAIRQKLKFPGQNELAEELLQVHINFHDPAAANPPMMLPGISDLSSVEPDESDIIDQPESEPQADSEPQLEPNA